MDTFAIIILVIIILLILLSALFSSAETAFTSVNIIKIHSLAQENNKKAILADKILSNKSKMLSAILIGNNVVNISASSLATILASRVSLPVALMTAVLTVIVIILGEIVPKNWAMVYCEKICLSYCGFIYALMTILTPVIFLVDHIAHGILKLFRIRSDYREAMTEGELKSYVDVSHEDGVIESDEREMILNVFDFSDAEAKDIMIPRVNMTTVKVTDTFDEVQETFRQSMYTRLPVLEEDDEDQQDKFLGLINIKDFIFCEDSDRFLVRDHIRSCLFTHEHKKISDLLEEMRMGGYSISFVTNEYGDTVGMITIEDLLEEIVGEIRDEYDEDEKKLIERTDKGSYIVDGSMNLDNINDELGLSLKSDDYDSAGGVLIEKLDSLPEEGEEVILEDGTKLRCLKMDGSRIEKVEIIVPEKKQSADESSSSDN